MHRSLQTDLCASLWTGWGRMVADPGTCREQPVENVGTTHRSSEYQQVTAQYEGVDNFLSRHAAIGALGVSEPLRDRPLGASDRSLGDVGVTFRRAAWTGAAAPLDRSGKK
jgi:hypothetical protein